MSVHIYYASNYERCIVGYVSGVTILHGVVYIVCRMSSTILRFNATTHQRQTDIIVRDMKSPLDIAACEQTSQLYVPDWEGCVWRVSAGDADIKRWLPRSASASDTFYVRSLSVTSTRLLVTSLSTCQLTQFDAEGDELRRVQLPDYMEPHHAVESPSGMFVVGHNNARLNKHQISEVNADGTVIRHFSGSSLDWTEHVAVDSHGNIFVADFHNQHILLLDAQLKLRRIVVDEHQLNYEQPYRLCYREQSGQLLVGYDGGVAMFDVLRC